MLYAVFNLIFAIKFRLLPHTCIPNAIYPLAHVLNRLALVLNSLATVLNRFAHAFNRRILVLNRSILVHKRGILALNRQPNVPQRLIHLHHPQFLCHQWLVQTALLLVRADRWPMRCLLLLVRAIRYLYLGLNGLFPSHLLLWLAYRHQYTKPLS